jgi:prophage regulatory protein
MRNEKPTRARRPIGIPPGELPDDALVDKTVRRAMCGLGDSQVYMMVREGRFPAPLKLGERCVRWRMGDLRRWLADPVKYRVQL